MRDPHADWSFVARIDDDVFVYDSYWGRLNAWSRDDGVSYLLDPEVATYSDFAVLDDALFYVESNPDNGGAETLYRLDPGEHPQTDMQLQRWTAPAIADAWQDWFA